MNETQDHHNNPAALRALLKSSSLYQDYNTKFLIETHHKAEVTNTKFLMKAQHIEHVGQ
jgi:hypothetical protein